MAASLFGLAKIYMEQGKYRQALAAIDAARRCGAGQSKRALPARARCWRWLGGAKKPQAEFATAQKMVNADHHKRRESLSDQRVPNPELAEPPQ